MLISVCIPSYRSAERIGRALESLVSQTRFANEIIVCDDASTDGTLDVVRQFADRLPLRIFRNESNLGMIRNWNRCLEHAKGEVVAFLHDDDAYRPGFLEEAERAFAHYDRLGLWACAMAPFERPDAGSVVPVSGPVSPDEYARLVFSMKFTPPPTVTVFRRSALTTAGFYSEEYRYMAEPDLYMRIFAAGFSGFNSAQVLCLRGTPDTRFTNRVWFTPLFADELARFIQQWHGHAFFEGDRAPLQCALAKTQSIVSRAIANNVLNVRLRYVSTIARRWNSMPSVRQRPVGEGTTLWRSVFNAIPGEIRRRLVESPLRPMLRAGARQAAALRSLVRDPVGTRRNRRVRVQGDEFAAALRACRSQRGGDRYRNLRDLFERTSLADFYAYYVSSHSAPHYRMPWGDGQLTKLPFDFVLYREIIERTRPPVVIEIGCQRGWSALWLASLVQPWRGEVITVDIAVPAAQSLFAEKRVTFVHGDATTADVAEKIGSLVAGRACMVIDDGSHRHDDVVAAARHYAKHVPVGGYYIVEDGWASRLLNGTETDALSAVDSILSEMGDFDRDDAFDDFVVFSAFQGVLRRQRDTCVAPT